MMPLFGCDTKPKNLSSPESNTVNPRQQLLGSVLELKKQFLDLNTKTKPPDLDISANNLGNARYLSP